MECNFYVGQKVVCVDAAPKSADRIPPLVEGVIYTIARIVRRGDEVGVSLIEVADMPPHPILDGSYDSRRFRPAVETKTDISALRQIVADVMAGRVREAV